MALLLAAFSAAIATPSLPRATRSARASITIVHAHRASHESWDPGNRPNQREVVKREADGALVRLRLTEFE